ncbi:hypothetical protein ACVOMV_33010 [Mesorhizobium atlanticum]
MASASETARQLAQLGFTVLMGVRDLAKGHGGSHDDRRQGRGNRARCRSL